MNHLRGFRTLSSGWLLLLGMAGLGQDRVIAQVDDYSSSTSLIDPYGNARPRYRAVGVYGGYAGGVPRQGYQYQARRGGTSTASMPFGQLANRSLPGRRGGGYTLPSRVSSLGFPLPYVPGTSSISSSLRGAFRQYGGFGRRPGGRTPGDLTTILTRRSSMIEAMSLNAPVQRAIWKFSASGPGAGGAMAARAVPFIPKAVPEPSPDAPSLGEALGRRIEKAREELRPVGWARFRSGDYRQAGRAFETPALLSIPDLESGIGDLFCHLSLGAMRTSMLVLEGLVRREPNPFLRELDVASRYGEQEEIQRVRLQVRLFAQGNSDRPTAQALRVLALWYLDERDEAIRNAVELARAEPGTMYAEWPTHMRALRGASGATGE